MSPSHHTTVPASAARPAPASTALRSTRQPQPAEADAPVSGDHRQRLLQGMASAVSTRGYAATTIADVVREAGVSRRTFYEHFVDKQACFLALHAAASRAGLAAMQAAIDPSATWTAQVRAALEAWFTHLGASPRLLRALFIEVPALGEPGLLARRAVLDALARFLLERAQAAGSSVSRQPALSPEMALAVVGGINELILRAIEQDRIGQLGDLVEPATALIALTTRRRT